MIVQIGPTEHPTAFISLCEKYRYSLTRTWNASKPRLLWVMLNPSTADALVDDPTIRKCIGFSERWVFGSIEVVNLFALRATNPKELDGHVDPVGPLNDAAIDSALGRSSAVVAAWGSKPYARDRAKVVLDRIFDRTDSVFALRLNKDGSPQHPLYVPYETEPTEMVKS